MLDNIREKIITILFNRLTVVWVILCALAGVLIYRCFKLQIVEGQEYLDNFVLEQEKSRDINPTRGNIFDRNGNLLAYNELAYSVKIEDTFESGKDKNKQLNELIYRLIGFVERNGDDVVTDFKIYLDEDNEFTYSASGTSLLRFLADVYDRKQISDLKEEEITATPLEVMEHLSRNTGKGYYYAIGNYADPEDKKSEWIPGDGYTRSEWLKMVTLRYAMSQTSYRKYIGTTVATDVCDETVALILENSDILPGVTIEEDSVRRYVDSMYFSHILGYTGKISSDELALLNDQLLEQGNDSFVYSNSDVVGKSGIESYMEITLQGVKGYEKVMVDNTGKVISVLETKPSVSGEDVYLTIDKDITIAVYNLTEQKLAGLVASKIVNKKEYIPAENATSSSIQIPIYDVYFQVINNNVIDIKHFTSEFAQETERAVYEAYEDYKLNAYFVLNEELYNRKTVYSKLSNEYQIYESNIVNLLIKNGIIMSEKIDEKDPMYLSWTTYEDISLSSYLEYAISMNWIDTSKLDLNTKYADSDEVYDAVVEEMFLILDNNTEFQKKFYKYMLLNDKISGKQICMLLYEQDACHIPIDEITALKNGKLSAYQFMMNRIESIDITPAQLALDPCNASVVITDVNTGDVIAMVSYPGYDNNMMANSVDADYYEKLTSDKASPLLNFATQYKAAPGSTFKIVSATAGLMEGVINSRSQIRCVGLFDLVEPSPKCWNVWGHGNENVQTAIRDSCNYFFYSVGYELASASGTYVDADGISALYEYADLFGLASKSGVEIAEYDPNISDNDAVRSAIGQGTNSLTTSQLARYAAAIANSGTVYDLTLLGHTERADGTVTWVHEPSIRNYVDIPLNYWTILHQGMRDVVKNKSYYNNLGLEVAGKTGTAQQSTSRPSHALFICYAPYDTPEIAMAVRIPFGYSSDYAAQLSRDILKYYYNLVDDEELIDGKADSPDEGVTNEL